MSYLCPKSEGTSRKDRIRRKQSRFEYIVDFSRPENTPRSEIEPETSVTKAGLFWSYSQK